MTNSWALLYDELYGEDKMNEDSIEIGLGNTDWSTSRDPMDFYSGYEVEHFNLDTTASYQASVDFDQNNEIRPKSERKRDNRYKYHESEIISDIEEYVSGTYNGHYTGDTHEYRNVQTIDLMAARSLASAFCQSNILKYGSRYGSKDGKNKKDLMKVIHYAMLLLHFDEHYGKPKMTSGEIDHNMP